MESKEFRTEINISVDEENDIKELSKICADLHEETNLAEEKFAKVLKPILTRLENDKNLSGLRYLESIIHDYSSTKQFVYSVIYKINHNLTDND